MPELHRLTLREIAAGVQARRFSAADVVRDHARCIEAREPQVQAWEHLDLERALRHADDLHPGGSLQGVPIAVKDIIDVECMPTRYGSRVFAAAEPAAVSAECVQALESAGAIVLGKSVTTEFAYYTPGKARNPWNPAHTPGGSSMGSAAAVACGMAAGAIGTQTNGSVIRPAAFCGVVGFKPSYGTVSNHGTMDPWPSLDHTGVFARRVDDASALASVITNGAVSPTLRLPASALRFAVVRSPVWHLASQAQQALLAAVASTLGHAGARIDEVELPAEFDEAHRVHRTIMAYEGARHFQAVQARHRAELSPQLNALLDEGAATAEADYRSALGAMCALRDAYAAFVRGCDAVLTPPAPGEAPATLQETGNPAFCTIWTLVGAPAITIPVERGPAGLPLGLQVVGAPAQDDALLAAAAWCEAHLPFHGL